MSEQGGHDLIVLVADKNMEFSVDGLLSRTRDLGLKPVKFAIRVHPHRDPGCLRRSDDFLRPFLRTCKHALVLFDRRGCGRDAEIREELERSVERRLERSGWAGRASAIAIDPELENWIWNGSLIVAKALGWEDRSPNLRDWLGREQLWHQGDLKPHSPKKAIESALRESRRPRSSAIYRQIAVAADLARCQDPAFLKLKDILMRWFQS